MVCGDGEDGPPHDFVTLCRALALTELDESLNMVDDDGGGNWTIFAPTDEAFADLPTTLVEILFDDAAVLRETVLFHAVRGEALYAGDLPCNGTSSSTALRRNGNNSDTGGLIGMANGGGSRTLCVLGVPTYQGGGGNIEDRWPRIVAPNVEACNGVIHVVNGVLLDEMTVGSPPASMPSSSSPPTEGSVTNPPASEPLSCDTISKCA
jgi:transforming growth factor-beta-induced protein